MLLAILGLLGSLAPIVLMFLGDRGAAKKEKKEETQRAQTQIEAAVADRDPTALTLGSDALTRVLEE